MRKTVSLLFALIAALSLSLPAFALTATYDQKVSVNGNPVADIKIQTKNENLKAESEFQGMKMIILRSAKGTFSYYPLQKMAAKIPAEMDKPNVTTQIPNYKAFLEQNGAKNEGTEKVDGKDTDVYTFIEPSLKRPGKAWLLKENQCLNLVCVAPKDRMGHLLPVVVPIWAAVMLLQMCWLEDFMAYQ